MKFRNWKAADGRPQTTMQLLKRMATSIAVVFCLFVVFSLLLSGFFGPKSFWFSVSAWGIGTVVVVLLAFRGKGLTFHTCVGSGSASRACWPSTSTRDDYVENMALSENWSKIDPLSHGLGR